MNVKGYASQQNDTLKLFTENFYSLTENLWKSTLMQQGNTICQMWILRRHFQIKCPLYFLSQVLLVRYQL